MSEIIERPQSGNKRARQIARSIYKHEIAPLAFVLVGLIFVMGALTNGLTLSLGNIRNLLLLNAIKGVAYVGQTFVLLSGGVDISIGGNALFTTVLGAGLMTSGWMNLIGDPLPLPVGALVMLAAGAAWGMFNSVMVAKVGIPGLMSTLGLWQILNGLAWRINSGRSVTQLPDALAWWGSGDIGGVPVPVVVFIAVLAVTYYVLNYTAYGRAVYYTGGNSVSAWLSGINVKKIQFSVYVIAGLLSGLAAFLMLGRVQVATMRSMSNLELMSIAACTVGGVSISGGKGSILGVVLGTLIVGVVQNGLNVMNAPPDVVGIILGAIIIVAVVIDHFRRQRS